jgi:ribosome-interacting GTPase 1
VPTNLPPDYFNLEKRFREAQTPAEKVALLEEMISVIPKHKGTDHLRADLRRQLSRLREEAQSRKKHGGHISSYQVEREGAGQVVLIGPTNVGKSALVAALTNAVPEVSAAPYTTRKPLPGMMPFENIQVQLIDTPPMDREFVEAGLFDLVRHADLVLLVVDLLADPLEQLEETLAQLREHRIAPLKPHAPSLPEERTVFLPLIVLLNKWDGEDMDELYEVCCELLGETWRTLPVSAVTGRNFATLKRAIYDQLDVIRVFAKPPGKEPDLEKPFVLKHGSTVIDLAAKVHRDFYEKLKSARVWGSGLFDGQMVPRDYVLQEGDIVELKI